MSLPETPKNPGPFSVQHGYADIQFKTHTYSDKPTALPGHQSKASEFVSSKTDKEHQKKYGKQFFNFLVTTLCK
ncbi:hypothetical protein OXX69_005529 [Metschnikowia pulcherrima]